MIKNKQNKRLRNYGVIPLEERKEVVKAMLVRGCELNVFDIMRIYGWSKSCAYTTLKKMNLVEKRINRLLYFSLSKDKCIKKITPGERLKTMILFYSVTERRCAIWT